MKSYRVFSTILIFVLVVNSFVPVIPVKAQTQPLFEGMIAFVDKTKNIVVIDGSGYRQQITSDAREQEDISYSHLSFSPNGKYLAFVRNDDILVVYDVENGVFVKEFEYLYPASFVQWHIDSDSFITTTHEDVEVGWGTVLNSVYRQYLSGKKTLLGEYYEDDAGYTINLDLNTVFYTPEEATTPTGTLYNWAKNTNYQVEMDDWGVGGFWAPDGRHYVITGHEESYSIIDLETGGVVKNISLYDVFPSPPGTHWAGDYVEDISPDSRHLLLVHDKQLYNLDLDTLTVEALYLNYDHEFHGNWSRSGKIILIDEFLNTGERNIGILETGHALIPIASNAAPIFWLSGNSDRLVYVQYGNNEGDERRVSNTLMIYDHEKKISTKIGDLPDLEGLEIWYMEANEDMAGHANKPIWDFNSTSYVAWTDGKVDLPVNLGTVPLVTMTPDASAPQGITPSETTSCPFEIIFQEKEGVINSLLNPAQASELDTGIDIPLPSLLLDPSKWQYDENGAKDKVASLRKECEGYANGTMMPDQKSEFERKIMAFKRLTYTEIALNGMYPQFVNTAHETSKSTSEVLIGAFSSLYMLGEIGGWLGNKDTTLATLVDKFFIEAKSFLLELVDSFLNRVIAKMGDLGRMTQFTFQPVLQMAQVLVDPKSKLDDIGIESVFEKLLTGLFLSKYVNLTQSEINIAVANVPPGSNINYQYLEIYGTDLEGEQAIDTLLQKSTQDTEQAIATMQTWINSAENVDIVSGVSQLTSTGLLVISPVAGPAAPVTLSLATFLKDLAAVMKVIVLAIQGKSAEVGISNLNQITLYATNSADIAFDPIKISIVAAQENQIINLDVASLDFVPANYMPASIYYARYQTQTVISVDNYKSSVERLMQTIAGGQDEQIRLAAEELLRVDEDLRASLKIAEAPLNDMPFDRPEVQNLDFSVQDLRAQSVTLHVALMAYMVERTSPEIQQETQTIVSDVLISADNFKTSYETLSQSGLAIPSKFLPVILDVKTPETIAQGDTFSLTVKILNVGQISQQSPVTLSVAGGDKVSTFVSQSLPEILSGSQVEIPVNLTASKSGDEFVVAEIFQDGSVIASKVVWLEIGKPDNIFAIIPTQYLLVGGLGLLCLGAFAIGGVFIFTRSRKPKRASSKIIKSQLSQTPISSSTEQIKYAIQLAKSNRLQEAFDILREVVKSEPNNASAWFNLGGVLVHMENYRDAERCYSRAKHLGHPRADEALNSLKQKR